MGIDIYAKWDGMSREEEQAQITGYSAVQGRVGYLREAYHGEPYATLLLVPEAFDEGEGNAEIPARLMRQRLPQVLEAAEQREKLIYGETDPLDVERVLDSFRDFVTLCERKERETGRPCRIIASY